MQRTNTSGTKYHHASQATCYLRNRDRYCIDSSLQKQLNINNCYNNNLQQDQQQQQPLLQLKSDHFGSSSVDVATNATITASASAEQYYYKKHNKLTPQILHVLWGRPLSTIDRTFAGKERKFDEDSFTGCCDQLVELALNHMSRIYQRDIRFTFGILGVGIRLDFFVILVFIQIMMMMMMKVLR